MAKDKSTTRSRSAPSRATKPPDTVKQSRKRAASKPKTSTATPTNQKGKGKARRKPSNANQAVAGPPKPKKRKKKSAMQLKNEDVKKRLAQALHDISGTKANHFLKKLVAQFKAEVDMTNFNKIADRGSQKKSTNDMNVNDSNQPEPPLIPFLERYRIQKEGKGRIGNSSRVAVPEHEDSQPRRAPRAHKRRAKEPRVHEDAPLEAEPVQDYQMPPTHNDEGVEYELPAKPVPKKRARRPSKKGTPAANPPRSSRSSRQNGEAPRANDQRNGAGPFDQEPNEDERNDNGPSRAGSGEDEVEEHGDRIKQCPQFIETTLNLYYTRPKPEPERKIWRYEVLEHIFTDLPDTVLSKQDVEALAVLLKTTKAYIKATVKDNKKKWAKLAEDLKAKRRPIAKDAAKKDNKYHNLGIPVLLPPIMQLNHQFLHIFGPADEECDRRGPTAEYLDDHGYETNYPEGEMRNRTPGRLLRRSNGIPTFGIINGSTPNSAGSANRANHATQRRPRGVVNRRTSRTPRARVNVFDDDDVVEQARAEPDEPLGEIEHMDMGDVGMDLPYPEGFDEPMVAEEEEEEPTSDSENLEPLHDEVDDDVMGLSGIYEEFYCQHLRVKICNNKRPPCLQNGNNDNICYTCYLEQMAKKTPKKARSEIYKENGFDPITFDYEPNPVALPDQGTYFKEYKAVIISRRLYKKKEKAYKNGEEVDDQNRELIKRVREEVGRSSKVKFWNYIDVEIKNKSGKVLKTTPSVQYLWDPEFGRRPAEEEAELEDIYDYGDPDDSKEDDEDSDDDSEHYEGMEYEDLDESELNGSGPSRAQGRVNGTSNGSQRRVNGSGPNQASGGLNGTSCGSQHMVNGFGPRRARGLNGTSDGSQHMVNDIASEEEIFYCQATRNPILVGQPLPCLSERTKDNICISCFIEQLAKKHPETTRTEFYEYNRFEAEKFHKPTPVNLSYVDGFFEVLDVYSIETDKFEKIKKAYEAGKPKKKNNQEIELIKRMEGVVDWSSPVKFWNYVNSGRFIQYLWDPFVEERSPKQEADMKKSFEDVADYNPLDNQRDPNDFDHHEQDALHPNESELSRAPGNINGTSKRSNQESGFYCQHTHHPIFIGRPLPCIQANKNDNICVSCYIESKLVPRYPDKDRVELYEANGFNPTDYQSLTPALFEIGDLYFGELEAQPLFHIIYVNEFLKEKWEKRDIEYIDYHDIELYKKVFGISGESSPVKFWNIVKNDKGDHYQYLWCKKAAEKAGRKLGTLKGWVAPSPVHDPKDNGSSSYCAPRPIATQKPNGAPRRLAYNNGFSKARLQQNHGFKRAPNALVSDPLRLAELPIMKSKGG